MVLRITLGVSSHSPSRHTYYYRRGLLMPKITHESSLAVPARDKAGVFSIIATSRHIDLFEDDVVDDGSESDTQE